MLTLDEVLQRSSILAPRLLPLADRIGPPPEGIAPLDQFREALLLFDGMHRFIPALIRNMGWRVTEVPVNHRPRLTGASKYTNFGRLLVSHYREIEREMYVRSKIHPAMHVLAIRRDVYERNPWIAASLFKAFNAAKDWAVDRMRVSITQSTMFPWHLSEFDEIEQLMGGDPWPYGIEPNRSTLEALILFLHQQHMISRRMPVEELFVPLKGLFD